MLDTVFMQVLDMTKAAGIVILFVLAARLLLRRAPKIFSYALWAVVLFRLLCPVSIEAPVSVVPRMEPIAESYTLADQPISFAGAGYAAQRAVGDALNGGLGVQHIPTTEPTSHGGAEHVTSSWWEVWILFGQYVWLSGVAAMAAYGALSFLRLRRRLAEAVPLRDNIYLADRIDSPFVMGLFRPKIYLPSSLAEREQGYIILHEQHHIRRLDHIVKALFFLALCIHWFNPLAWAAFILSSKDMEMSCDEAVVKKLGEGIRADYSASLLSLSTRRRIIAGTPLAFGEGDTRSRIQNILRWKKPRVWLTAAAALLCVIVTAACAGSPGAEDEPASGIRWAEDLNYPEAVVAFVNDYVAQQIEAHNTLGSGDAAIGGTYTITDAEVVNLTALHTGVLDEDRRVVLYRLEYRLLPSEPDHVVLAGGMQLEDGWITEWSSTGQPYLAMLRDESSGKEVWTLLGTTNTDDLFFDYGTEEMLLRYGEKYTAAAMELYHAYLHPEAPGPRDAAEEVSYYLELAAGVRFRDMGLGRQKAILAEYSDLLAGYTLIARETADGTSSYIVGAYPGDIEDSPLHGMYGIEVFTGEDEAFQFLYREEESGTVEAVLAANKTEFPPSAGYRIEDSQLFFPNNAGVILIQPKNTELSLDVALNRYLYTPNGRAYIADAASRGIDMCSQAEPFLYVYRISERFGEIAERISLTEAEAAAILAEDRVNIAEGSGFSATLHMDGQTTYYNEREGVPQTVLDLAEERCEYRFETPAHITSPILEARLDGDWLEAPCYADKTRLAELTDILKNAEFGYVGGCGYGARVTLTLAGGKQVTVFKGTDDCDTIVFGSYGGYFLGEKANLAFWEIFGLDPATKTPRTVQAPGPMDSQADSVPVRTFGPADVEVFDQVLQG